MAQQVLKAVIPAAGLGTRFLPATKAQPKEMLPLVDKPAIQYVVEEAVSVGITDILVITGRGKRSLEDHFDRSFELEYYLAAGGKEAELEEMRSIAEMANIHYVRQGEPRGLGHAVLVASEHVGNLPFAVLLGDDIMHPGAGILAGMLKAYEQLRPQRRGIEGSGPPGHLRPTVAQRSSRCMTTSCRSRTSSRSRPPRRRRPTWR